MSALSQARRRLADARAAGQRAQAQARAAAADLERLRRQLDPGNPRVLQAEAEYRTHLASLERVRGEQRAAREAIAAGVGAWLGPDTHDEVAQLDAGFPIVLFPIRLETRFQLDGPELRIRVYPDAIAADLHDAALTRRERALGEEYWHTAWDPPAERQAWRVLLTSMRPMRAAWIVRATTPTNLLERPSGAPRFPPTEPRPDTWSRAAETRLLPDRWIALAYRGGAEVRRVVGRPIQEPLALTLAPDAVDDELVRVADELKIDAELLWTIDFTRAEEIGMALRMPLGAAEVEGGLERLIVVGVKGSLPADEAGSGLAALLEGHHYSRGLALLAPGTPTNNTGLAPAAYPPPSDPDHAFAIERGAPLTSEGSDGTRLATALGVPAEILAHVESAGRTTERGARAMNEALWPATLGYYTEQMLWPAMGAATVAQVRRHFAAHVRGGGPLPAFRAGTTPYAVLPVTSIRRWRPPIESRGFEARLAELMRRAREVWLRAAADAPRVGRTTDPDADLLAVLGLDASTRVVRIRQVSGPGHWRNLALLLGIDERELPAPLEVAILGPLGLVGLDARVLGMVFAAEAHRYRYALVTDEPLSEVSALAPNYIRSIREASIRSLLTSRAPGEASHRSLLARMLRHGALTEYRRIGLDVLIGRGLATEADRREPELVGIVPGTENRPTLPQRFEQAIPGTDLRLGDWLTGPGAPAAAHAYRASLVALEGLPTAELQRLFSETLDACSHRLDAWLTSLATSRLSQMRATRPLGCHLGGYGWVEELRPRSPRAPGGGHIHAPSMAHAATAAVLRNAFLGRQGQGRAQVRIDLSSARVRRALRLFDGVRQGQPAGALLGYSLERTLHDARLDVYIEPLRRLYPLATDSDRVPVEPGAAMAPRSVVDGLALRAAWTEGRVPFGAPGSGLPASGDDFDGIVSALRVLDDAVDAAADLMLAESVHQAVRGHVDAAGAALFAAAGGGRVPEPDVVASPRGGINIIHRVALALGEPPGPGPGWRSAPTPRAAAEPRLDAWLGTLLGDPRTVRCRVLYPDPTPEEPDRRGERVVALSELELRPTDVVAASATELERRVLWVAAEVPAGAAASVEHAADPSWDRAVVRTFAEVMEVTAGIQSLIGGARPLEARDLRTPGGSEVPAWDVAELEARAGAARARLQPALAALREARAAPNPDPDRVRSALFEAALFGLAEALPARMDASSSALPALLDQAGAVERALERREQAAATSATPIEALMAILGPAFVALPLVQPPEAPELERALAHGPGLVDELWGVHKWMQRAARVRPALARLRMVGLTAEALGAPQADYEVVQIPHREGARWAALPFVDDRRPASGTLSLVLRRAFGAIPAAPWAGLLVDEWVESIPSAVQDTGIAVHHDDPGAEAPQAVLVAVPPAGGGWDLPTLVDILHETLDLARIRAVDAEHLGELAPLLPAVYFASNVADDTVSTNFLDLVMTDPLILER